MIWLFVVVLVIALNVPFGYWRENVGKFSAAWFLSVHLPIPVIIFFRIHFRLGWGLSTFPLLIGAYFLGQVLGARIRNSLSKRINTGNCLFYDLVRLK